MPAPPDALRSWIDTARGAGDPVPPRSHPPTLTAAAGTCACPQSLHRRLALGAQPGGGNLNTVAVRLLAKSLGRPAAGPIRVSRHIERTPARAAVAAKA